MGLNPEVTLEDRARRVIAWREGSEVLRAVSRSLKARPYKKVGEQWEWGGAAQANLLERSKFMAHYVMITIASAPSHNYDRWRLARAVPKNYPYDHHDQGNLVGLAYHIVNDAENSSEVLSDTLQEEPVLVD